MSQPLIDELSPVYVRAEAFKLTPVDPNTPARAFRGYDILVDYTAGNPEGVRLPLVLTVNGPSEASFHRHVYQRVAPSTITFTPKEGGKHTVTLQEVGHNRWYGSYEVDVAGEQIDP